MHAVGLDIDSDLSTKMEVVASIQEIGPRVWRYDEQKLL